MSSAFVRDQDDQWLHEIPPTINALIQYLTRENNGIGVYVKNSYLHPAIGKDVHEMSNGMTYGINNESQWYVVD
jgi:hypothetical protein